MEAPAPPTARPLPLGPHFTARSVVAGLGVGTVICAANVYFGLQTGWVSIMSMPASLMGFGVFRLLRHHLQFPFSPVENVLLQSVACGMGIMPLGCGFVGVIPAMTHLLTPDEQGPLHLSVGQLIVWSLGLSYFGVVFAVPLRHQVIVRERLRFPSGFGTAVLISVLHGQNQSPSSGEGLGTAARGGFASFVPPHEPPSRTGTWQGPPQSQEQDGGGGRGHGGQLKDSTEWASNMRLLLLCFMASGVFTVSAYFIPVLRNVPIFGRVAAQTWLWTLNPSLAYVGQGIIMGAETTLHMAFGAVIGWALLSPLAKHRGWAPGPVQDWEHGSKGWIVWISLAIMLSDAVVSLGYVALRPLLSPLLSRLSGCLRPRLYAPGSFERLLSDPTHGYSLLLGRNQSGYRTSLPLPPPDGSLPDESEAENGAEHDDAPPEHRIGGCIVTVGLALSTLLCVATIRIVFANLVPLYATVSAVLMALVLSIMGVRALGETDLNPVSGISKLAQLFFAIIVRQSNKSSVVINLIAGAVSEAGALQAGDLMQDLKTGHLLGAAPKAQFWGQIIGATVGAVLSAFIYRLYTTVYTIPGDLFPVPTAYVWIFTARLVTGQGLPPMAKEWALGSGGLFAIIALIRTLSVGKQWRGFVPGGIAVAVGMYNVPSFTLARAVGGLFGWYWLQIMKRHNTSLVIMASGFILGEGFLSIVNLILQGVKAPHF